MEAKRLVIENDIDVDRAYEIMKKDWDEQGKPSGDPMRFCFLMGAQFGLKAASQIYGKLSADLAEWLK